MSKIENGSLQPEVILAETLLTRLGVSEREFVFWGNAREAKFYELKFRLRRNRYLEYAESEKTLAALEAFLGEEDILYRQYFLYMKSQHIVEQSAERMSLLQRALECTLKKFDISRIMDYRLSWMELTILNNIAYEYRYAENPCEGIRYFRHILNYHREARMDIILQAQTFSAFYYLYNKLLNAQKYFREIIDLMARMKWQTAARWTIDKLAGIYFYSCQAMGECEKVEGACAGSILLWFGRTLGIFY